MIDERAASHLRGGLEHSRLQQQWAGQTAGPFLTAGHEGGQDAHGGTQHPWRLQPHVEACGHIIRYVVLGLCNVIILLPNDWRVFIRFIKRKISLKTHFFITTKRSKVPPSQIFNNIFFLCYFSNFQ
jgi:hypothetical protein